MPCRVGIDPKRLLRVVRTVEQEPCAEAQGAFVLRVELVDGRDGEIEVELLRYVRCRPGRYRKLADTLEGDPPAAVRLLDHEPLVTGRVGRLMPRPVDQPEQLAIELRELPGVGAIEHHLQESRKSS